VIFVNRDRELNLLEQWWARPGPSMGIVWGRRRVGKTGLIERFASARRAVFHTAAGRLPEQEMAALHRAAAHVVPAGTGPFKTWEDAFEALAAAAELAPLLVVLDEFPDLVAGTPWLPGYMRAMWDRVDRRSGFKLLLSGSAVRTMHAMQAEREPLYGRFDLRLLLHPFRPHEAAQMLPGLAPAERALVWGMVGGSPLYLRWWDQQRSLQENLELLVCQPGSRLLTEGMLVLASEADAGDGGQEVLYAIAGGRTKPNEIADAVRRDPAPALRRFEELRIVEQVVPVTEDTRRPRRWTYRIADNFLAFWLTVLDPYRNEIDRGFGESIVPSLLQELNEFMGMRWEEAFRMHLRRLNADGRLGDTIVAIGPYWSPRDDPVEIDAVVMAGADRPRPVLAGEAKWARRVDAARIRRDLERKVRSLPGGAPGGMRYAVCARETVDNAAGVLAVTAADIFDG
jgi:AAA+ ATPase superfamily predicted ATPase